MKTKKLFLGVALLALLFSCNKDTQITSVMDDDGFDVRAQVVLPAGSVDGLADAVAAAGPNGTVIVQSGNHYLSGMVTISHRVRIKGEPGAVITSAAQPTDLIDPMQVALYVLGADKTVIEGLEFRAESDPGGTAILVHNSEQVTVKNNSFHNFQFSILLEQASKSIVSDNYVACTFAGLLGQLESVLGIVAINGHKVQIRDNTITNGIFGLWACDRDGIAQDNEFFGNFIGLILCKVPDESMPLPDGGRTGSALTGTNWVVVNNNAYNNFHVGYLVVDGANNNQLNNNAASGNADYDIELTTVTSRFGFEVPGSYNNHVNVGGANAAVTVKDCGVNNTVIGGTHIDINADPCY
jgi:hypothetical protein